uniref:Uncharacterized protein n=1 Tax=Panthera tigris altaica TaxID=74533 RepID=A0A8C9MAK7_PANTA
KKNQGLLEAIFVNILVTEVYCKYICIVRIFLFNFMLPSFPWNFFPQIRVIVFTRGKVWITD